MPRHGAKIEAILRALSTARYGMSARQIYEKILERHDDYWSSFAGFRALLTKVAKDNHYVTADERQTVCPHCFAAHLHYRLADKGRMYLAEWDL